MHVTTLATVAAVPSATPDLPVRLANRLRDEFAADWLRYTLEDLQGQGVADTDLRIATNQISRMLSPREGLHFVFRPEVRLPDRTSLSETFVARFQDADCWYLKLRYFQPIESRPVCYVETFQGVKGAPDLRHAIPGWPLPAHAVFAAFLGSCREIVETGWRIGVRSEPLSSVSIGHSGETAAYKILRKAFCTPTAIDLPGPRFVGGPPAAFYEVALQRDRSRRALGIIHSEQ